MKLILLNRHNSRIALTTIMLIISMSISFASNTVNQVIISGQVTNLEYGNAIEGHTVYIKSDSTRKDAFSYSKVLKTNSEGYYYDTIATSVDNGSLIVFTYDHFGIPHDTTVYFRFIDRGTSVIIADFLIYLPYQAKELQARFKYIQKTSRSNDKFKFIDQTNHKYIIGWHWDFGDGTISNIQNPTHSYQSYGLFKVGLTVTALVNNMPTESTITKQIYICETEYFHLGGHVFSEYFPIDIGRAYLYMVDSMDRFFSVDTIIFDTLGYYYFYQIPEGNYVVKVEPTNESEYYGELMPTYFGDQLFWDAAEIVHLHETNWECDIMLSESFGVFKGEGSLSGKVKYINLPRSIEEFSVKGVNIHLFDDSNNLLTCHYSDDEGNFSFELIELNTYWLYPEIAGKYTGKVELVLTPETPNISEIEILVDTYGINEIAPDADISLHEVVGLPYPNPVSGTLNFPVNSTQGSNMIVDIFDISGNKIASDQIELIADISKYQIVTTNLKEGVYVARLKVSDRIFNRIFVVAR